MSAFSSPWAFFYANLDPINDFFVGLSYYQSQAELPARLKLLKWICLVIVLTILVGLTFAAETMLQLK